MLPGSQLGYLCCYWGGDVALVSVMFGDGREERLAAGVLALRLASDPKVTARRENYNRRVSLARNAAKAMPKDAVIDALCKQTPAYIRDFLETEDDRFGLGALAERYARTFWREFS